MKRSLWALPICVIGASLLVITAGAQKGPMGHGGTAGGTTVNTPTAPAPAPGPFVLGNHVWPSKEAFILSGARCGTPQPSLNEMLALEQLISSNKPQVTPRGRARTQAFHAATINVPVYVHIITDSAGNGDISDADIAAGIAMMNDSYAGLDKRDKAFKISAQETANTPYRFVLQGTDRAANDAWFQGDIVGMKTTLRVGGPETLNIYTTELGGGLLGFATFPDWYQSDPLMDGVVVTYETWINGAFTGYNLGDTTVHEVGHWLGLYHTFQGSCFRPGDGVTDTPAEAGPYWGTPTFTGYPDSCTIQSKPATQTASPGRDPIENFMDYSDDIVMYQFTQGQSLRMQKITKFFRNL